MFIMFSWYQSGKVYLQRCNSTNSSASTMENKQQSNHTVGKLQDLNFPPSSKLQLNLFDETNLDLKLVPSSASSPSSSSLHSVCTLEKVKYALERAEKESSRKRSMSLSNSSSPLSNSLSSIRDCEIDQENTSASFAAGCPSCLLYVLISKSSPRCPRCNTVVPSPTLEKKPRIDLNISIWNKIMEGGQARGALIHMIFCKEDRRYSVCKWIEQYIDVLKIWTALLEWQTKSAIFLQFNIFHLWNLMISSSSLNWLHFKLLLCCLN